MKAISLWEPWASLIANGSKTIETRSWKTNFRGDLLICAGKKNDSLVRGIIKAFQEPNIHRVSFSGNGENYPTLPTDFEPMFGQAVAIVEVVDCIRLSESRLESEDWRRASCLLDPRIGGWSLNGRWGWILDNIRPIEPFPVKGSQGFFNVELPEGKK